MLDLTRNLDAYRRAYKANILDQIATRRVQATSRELSDLYALSVLAYAATEFWATNLASVPFRLYDDNDNEIEDPDHELTRLLADSRFNDSIARLERSMRFWGWAIARRRRNANGYVRFLDYVNPALVTKNEDWNGVIRDFTIFSGRGEDNRREDETYRYKLEDVVYLAGFSFDDDNDGVSSAEVAYYQAMTEPAMAETLYSLFNNLGVPIGIMQPPADAFTNTGSAVDYGSEKNKLVQFLRATFMGTRNFGRALVTAARWEWLPVTVPFKDVVMQEQYDALRQAVAMAFNVSSSFFIPDQSNYAELEGQIDLWRVNWLKPRAVWYGEELTRQLCGNYPGLSIKPDLSDILKDDEGAKLDIIERKLGLGLIDLYEAQELIDKKPDPALKGLVMIEGVGPVPVAELPNLWRYRLNVPEMAVETPNLSIEAPVPAPLPDRPLPLLQSRNDFVSDAVMKEIQVATRKAAKSATFTPDALHAATVAYIEHLTAEGIGSTDIVNAAKAHYLRVTAAKAIQATRLDYEDTLESLFLEAVAGGVTKARFRTILTSQTDRAIDRAYRDGLRDGGVTFENDGDLTADDLEWIEAWKVEQRQYISGVIEAIYEDDKVTEDEAVGKPEMWFNKSVYKAYQEGLLSASRNAVYEWVLGDAEHCDSCNALSGQRRRMSFWSRTVTPKDDRLACNGFRCACNLVPTDRPVSRGKLPRWQFAGKHTHEDGEVCRH